MLEVRQHDDGFLVFDTQANEPVMRFDDRRDADRLVAEMQIQELHTQLQGWTLK